MGSRGLGGVGVPDFMALADEARGLNSSVFSLIRLQLLSNLAIVGQDGVTYRELKAALQVGDGALYTNLKVLQKMGYVSVNTVVLEKKRLDSYQITGEGLSEWKKVKAWLAKFVAYGGENNGLR